MGIFDFIVFIRSQTPEIQGTVFLIYPQPYRNDFEMSNLRLPGIKNGPASAEDFNIRITR